MGIRRFYSNFVKHFVYMKYIVSVLLLCIGVNFASAQEQPLMYSSSGRADHAQKKKKKEGFDPSKLIFGGGIVVAAGTDYTDLGISPEIGYRLTNNFSAGIGLGYEYSMIKQYDYYDNSYTNKANVISPGIWARYMVYRNKVFLEANYEYDMMHFSERYVDNSGMYAASDNLNLNVSCFLLGVGLKYPIAGNVSAVVELLYDVIQDVNSPYYQQPVFRFGVLVGL
jgi:hypothetical protein